MNEAAFIQSAVQQFRDYKILGEKTFAQISDSAFHFQPNEWTNSIAINITHLHGNMLSRWTDFLTTDGEKEWRQRDAEFENSWNTRDDVMKTWDSGWKCLFDALNSITDEDLERIIYIRNEGQTVLDAIQRQLAHYPHHVGQILYQAKAIKGNDFKSLSIPKGASADFNKAKFSEEKRIRHFTDKL